MNENLPNDLESIVARIVDKKLESFRNYDAKVMRIDDNGIVRLHVPDLSTQEEDPDTWKIGHPGNRMWSSIPPEVGTWLDVYPNSGALDVFRFTAFSHVNMLDAVEHAGDKKYVLLEVGDCLIFYDDEAKELVLRVGTTESKWSLTQMYHKVANNKMTLTSSKTSDTKAIESENEVTAFVKGAFVKLSKHPHVDGASGLTAKPVPGIE